MSTRKKTVKPYPLSAKQVAHAAIPLRPFKQQGFSPIFQKTDKNHMLSIGMNVDFIMGLTSLQFYFIEDAIEKLIPCRTNQLIYRTCYYFFDQFVDKDHQPAINQLFPKAIDLLQDNEPEDTILNLEFNISCDRVHKKRVLLQLKHHLDQVYGQEPILEGKLIDLSAVVHDGLPKLIWVSKNNVKKIVTYSPDHFPQAYPFGLTLKQINILQLKSEGKRAKEIAHALKSTELSVYSYIRDIKEKTSMEIIPLIHYLNEKGILS